MKWLNYINLVKLVDSVFDATDQFLKENSYHLEGGFLLKLSGTLFFLLGLLLIPIIKLLRLRSGVNYTDVIDEGQFIREFSEIEGQYQVRGVEIKADLGSEVKAPIDGVISKIEGDAISISKGEEVYKFKGVTTSLKEGQSITKGTVIGKTSRDTLRIQRGVVKEDEVEWKELPIDKVDVVRIKEPKFSVGKITHPKGSGAYREGCPSVGTQGRRASFVDDRLLCMNYLVHHLNITPAQAAGVIGNLVGESELNPEAFARIGGFYGAQGLAQWRGPRVKAFILKYGKMPVLLPDIRTQIAYVADELQNGVWIWTRQEERKPYDDRIPTRGVALLSKLKTYNTPESAAVFIQDFYEIPGNRLSESKRKREAGYAYQAYLDQQGSQVRLSAKNTKTNIYYNNLSSQLKKSNSSQQNGR